jgi:hypothetical protein
VRTAQQIAIVSAFSAAIIGSDFALVGIPNVKLLDTLVFVSAYVFGFRVGASVGILSETAWSFVSPDGVAGTITPFLVVGELLFALAGWGASKLWGKDLRLASPYPIFVGALLSVCAFLWDFETNAAYAFLASWPGLSLAQFLWYEFAPPVLVFTIAHEVSDFVLGMALAPTFILLIPKVMRGRR